MNEVSRISESNLIWDFKMNREFEEDFESFLSVPSLGERLKGSEKVTGSVSDPDKVPQLKRSNNNIGRSDTDIVFEDGDETVDFIAETISLEEYEKRLSPLLSRDRSSSREKPGLKDRSSSNLELERKSIIDHAPAHRIYDQHSLSDTESEFEAEAVVRRAGGMGKQNLVGSQKGQVSKRKKLSAEEKEELRQEKLREKAKKVAEKLREKAVKNAERAVKKAVRPGENLKYVTAMIDSDIITLWKGGEAIIQGLNESQITFKLQNNMVPYSVVWEKKTVEHLISQDGKVTEKTTTFDEEYVLLLIKFSEFLEKITGDSGSVDSFAMELRSLFCNKKIKLFITGMANYYKSKKNAETRNFRQIVRNEAPTQKKSRRKNVAEFVSREIVEDCLVELEITHSVSYVHVDNAKDFVNFVVSFTKAIADRDYKLNERQASFTFYSSSDMQPDMHCVKVDAAGNGLSRLWVNQIRQLPNVGLDTAHAIAAVYPLPACLKAAYERCRSESEAKLLLQDIVVRRGAGALTSTRRVGPELSKKIHNLFTSTDGSSTL